MLKEKLTYLLMFLIFFLCGLLLAFVWHKVVAKKHAYARQTAPAASASRLTTPVSRQTSSMSAAAVAGSPSSAQSAQAASPAPPVQAVLPKDIGSDVILLIDSSGSMKRTDPANYRKEASKLFISLLGQNDRVGVISFGDTATLLSPLMQNTEQNRTSLFSAVDRISSTEYSTNIYDAVQKGYQGLIESDRQGRFLLMMSDGELALGSPEKDKAAFTALNSLLPELAKSNIKLYTVAFTEESDRVLLERIALETGGFFRYAKTDKDVHGVFAAIFEKIKSPDTVPLEGDSFTIDKDIQEAIVLVTKKPGAAVTLVGPGGSRDTAAQHTPQLEWYQAPVFDMITIKEPAAGLWNVKLGLDEGGRIYVLTNLHLRSSFDKNFVTRGETLTIDVWLEKQNGIVTEQNVLETTIFSATVLGPDGQTTMLPLIRSEPSGELGPAVAKFSGKLVVAAAGEYTVNLLAKGKTFAREKAIPFKAVDASLLPPDHEQLRSRPHPVQTQSREEFSWLAVLFRFALVNLAVIGLTAAGITIRMIIIKMRPKR